MKRIISLLVVVILAFACYQVGCSKSHEFVSAVADELPAPVTSKVSSALGKAKELLSEAASTVSEGVREVSEGVREVSEDVRDGSEDQAGAPEDLAYGHGDQTYDPEDQAGAPDDQADDLASNGAWSLPSIGDIKLPTSKLDSVDDLVLVPTDDYAQGYVFDYGGEQFSAYFDGVSWRVYDSYKITDHHDITVICQALLNEHIVYGSDWASSRTADDMAFEWEQHNLAYKMLPKDSHWRDDAKDVDLDPYDQGKTFPEIYESRTGHKFDISKYLPGD